MALNDLVKGMLAELTKLSKSEVVSGNVREAGNAKVMPLVRVAIGFGTGGADAGGQQARDEGKRNAGIEGGAAGGAVVVEPKALVVIGQDGTPRLVALRRGGQAELRRGLSLPKPKGSPPQGG